TLYVALVLLLVTLTVATGPMKRGALFNVWRIASASETLQLILGVLAGTMGRAFPGWGIVGIPGHTWRLLTYVGAFGGVVLMALIVPYIPALLTRMTTFETPYAKFQFSITPAEKQFLLNVERDLLGFAQDTCNLVPQSHSSKKVRLLGQPVGAILGL